jgi:hypothetical protein
VGEDPHGLLLLPERIGLDVDQRRQRVAFLVLRRCIAQHGREDRQCRQPLLPVDNEPSRVVLALDKDDAAQEVSFFQ